RQHQRAIAGPCQLQRLLRWRRHRTDSGEQLVLLEDDIHDQVHENAGVIFFLDDSVSGGGGGGTPGYFDPANIGASVVLATSNGKADSVIGSSSMDWRSARG